MSECVLYGNSMFTSSFPACVSPISLFMAWYLVVVCAELGCEEHSHGRLVAPANNIHAGGWERSVVGILFAPQSVAQIGGNNHGVEFDGERQWQ